MIHGEEPDGKYSPLTTPNFWRRQRIWRSMDTNKMVGGSWPLLYWSDWNYVDRISQGRRLDRSFLKIHIDLTRWCWRSHGYLKWRRCVTSSIALTELIYADEPPHPPSIQIVPKNHQDQTGRRCRSLVNPRIRGVVMPWPESTQLDSRKRNLITLKTPWFERPSNQPIPWLLTGIGSKYNGSKRQFTGKISLLPPDRWSRRRYLDNRYVCLIELDHFNWFVSWSSYDSTQSTLCQITIGRGII